MQQCSSFLRFLALALTDPSRAKPLGLTWEKRKPTSHCLTSLLLLNCGCVVTTGGAATQSPNRRVQGRQGKWVMLKCIMNGGRGPGGDRDASGQRRARGRRRLRGKTPGDEISSWIKDEVIQRSSAQPGGKEDTLAVTSLP